MPDISSTSLRAGRRAFLGAGAALLVVAPSFSPAAAQSARPAAPAPDAARSGKVAHAAATLRDLWVDHIFWIRAVAVAALGKNDAAQDAAERQVLANAANIAASVQPFYGEPAKEAFSGLLQAHYGAVKAYLLAASGSDVNAQNNANQQLIANADDIAAFLSGANSDLNKATLRGMLETHGGHHVLQIQLLKDQKYDAEAQTWADMKAHVHLIADATADALSKQFPDKFG